MDLLNELAKIGLHKSEITIYLYLLENGLSTPPKIAKGTKIARTNCYHVLLSLKEKGLIGEQFHGKRKTYLANDPAALLRSWDQLKEQLTLLLPDLRGLYVNQKNKPKIKFYEGINQIQEIYLQSLEAKKIYGLGSTKQFSELMPKFYTQYTNEMKKRDIIFQDILTKSSKYQGAPEQINTLKGLYSAKFLSAEYEDLPTDILIWQDNIALITFTDPVFGTVLTNRQLAKTFITIFQLIWDKTD